MTNPTLPSGLQIVTETGTVETTFRADRVMPWYFLQHAPDGRTHGYGVKVRPAARLDDQRDSQRLVLPRRRTPLPRRRLHHRCHPLPMN